MSGDPGEAGPEVRTFVPFYNVYSNSNVKANVHAYTYNYLLCMLLNNYNDYRKKQVIMC